MEVNFYIETYGCSANKSDSEIIAGILSGAGLNLVNNPELADLIIINTCIVKQRTENKILGRIKEVRKNFPDKKLLIAGCMPEAYPELVRDFPEVNLISTHRITEILKVVRKIFDDKSQPLENTSLLRKQSPFSVSQKDGADTPNPEIGEYPIYNNKRIELLGKSRKEKVCVPKIRENKVIDIIQICSGCLGNCTYCGTKIAKGNLFSYSADNIVREIKIAKEQGCKEFWLTGQDVSCYGFDFDTNLAELLTKIVNEVKGKYFIRLGMFNPVHLLKIIDHLLEICEDERIFKFFHIPVQSGSDKVLKEMNRNYKTKEFELIIKKIRNKFPLATIGTDIIVGYPTETEEDFKKTLELLKKIKPDWTNVSKFGVRRKTKAAKLKPLKSEIVKERSEIVSRLVKEIATKQNRKWLNWNGEVLVDELFKARNFAYKLIHLNSKEIGKFVKMNIKKVEGLKLFGEIIN